MKLLILIAVLAVLAVVLVINLRSRAKKRSTASPSGRTSSPITRPDGSPLIRDGGMVPPLTVVDDDRDDEKYWRRYYSD